MYLIARLERFAAASGDFPAFGAAKDQFDQWLAAPPKRLSSDERIVLDALRLEVSGAR